MPPVFFIYLGTFWIVSGAKAKRRTGPKDVAPLIMQGQETVDVLAAAHEQLVKLIDRLREAPT